jgi:hypothetical protein
MKKPLYSAVFLASVMLVSAPSLVSAQTYNNQYGYSNSSSCISLTRYLSLGSSDSLNSGQVTMVQQFLNTTGYLRGVTGNFDQGTFGAVVNYQREHGISTTGTVGPRTRAAINAQSCNGNNSNNNSNNSSNGYGTVSISSLSNSSGYAGSSVTIYGTNLSTSNPVVHFGGSTVSISYSTSNSISFTIPSLSTGTYQIYVSNSYGTSNSLSYTITGDSYSNCSNNNSYQCGCTYPYTYNNGYSYSNCNNNNNNNSNSSNWFGGNGQPSISSVSGPSSVTGGSSNNWSVAAYSQTGLSYTIRVDWGDGTSQQSSNSNYSTSQQQTYPFSHTYTSNGTYTMRFTSTDSAGAYSYATFPVTVSGYNNNYNYNYGSTGTPIITYLSYTSATRGTNITIYGSNFTANDTVLFGGSTYGATSYNGGTAISFTIPYFSPGNYSVAVMNSNGQTSNSMNLSVQ